MRAPVAAGSLVDGLRATLSCDVVDATGPEYDRLRRVWNADIDRRPAAIVRCTTAADVAAAVRWCVTHDVPITVRGGGHNLAGTAVATGAVLIDTALLDHLSYDPDTGRVEVGAGCTWGPVDRALAGAGRAVPAGVVSHTGVAGLTLGGGVGYLGRMFGATVDYVDEMEVVLADGRILTVHRQAHPDLFWALRGAGHNYGIVTRFVFRTVAVPGPVTIRQQLFVAEHRKPILQLFRDFGPDAPANVGTYVRLLRAPRYWSQLPPDHRGAPVISVATVHYGDPADEFARTAPMFAVAPPIYDTVRTIEHVTLQHATDDEFRYGLGHYWKHSTLPGLDDDVIDLVLRHCDAYPGESLNSSAFIAHQLLCPFELIAGTRDPAPRTDDATAGIDGLFSVNIGADWSYPGDKPELVRWARAFAEDLAPHGGGTYINFTSVAGDDTVARAVYGAKYDRLVAVKQAYDPTDVFSRGLVDLAEGVDSDD
ncbi:FAD-binding oxidoreductase [Nocardia tengchongensis]